MLTESDTPPAEYRNAKDLPASKSSCTSKSVPTPSLCSIPIQDKAKSKSCFSLPIAKSRKEVEVEEKAVQGDKSKSTRSNEVPSKTALGPQVCVPETTEKIQKPEKKCSATDSSFKDTMCLTDLEPQTKSVDAQTASQELQINAQSPNISMPLTAVTLQSILIAARAKSAAKIPPKQNTIYQLSNDIIILIQQSLQSERDAYGFLGHPITSAEGHQIDRLAWWFWLIHRTIQDLNPPRGYILPALKTIRQDMSSVADVAVEMIGIQKNIHKQLHRMAGILNKLFGKHEDLFGVRDWENKLDEMRSEDASLVQEKLDHFLHNSECSVKLTAFEMKTLLIQHETNPEFKSVSLNKLGLKSQREFIKSCIEHVNSVLRSGCDHSVQAHQELHRVEKEIQESVDKLVRKLDQMRRFHRFRDSNCSFLLKKSLNALGSCFYEYIDMVRFIRKLGRFVLLASEHVLQHTNGWSHLCDVQCLQQLDNILEEFVEKERYKLLQCFRKRNRKEETRSKVMVSFEEYFQDWVNSNVCTVQVTLPMTNATAETLFEEEQLTPIERQISDPKSVLAKESSKASLPSVFSNEVEVTFINKSTNTKTRESPSEKDTMHKLEEIGIKIEPGPNLLQTTSNPGKPKPKPTRTSSRSSKKRSSKTAKPEKRISERKISSVLLDAIP